MDNAARHRPFWVGAVLAASRTGAISLAGYHRPRSRHPHITIVGGGGAYLRRLRVLDPVRCLGIEIRRGAGALSATRPDLLHGLRHRPQRGVEHAERRRHSLSRLLAIGPDGQADRYRSRLRHTDLHLGSRYASGSIFVIPSPLVGLRSAHPCMGGGVGRLCAARGGRVVSMVGVFPARVVALSADRDPGTERAYCGCADCRRQRGPVVRRRRALRAAAAASGRWFRRVCRPLFDCDYRRHHQQCARRRGRIRIGAAVDISDRAPRSIAGCAAGLSRHLLFRPVFGGAGIAGGARNLGSSRTDGATGAAGTHLDQRRDAASNRDRRIRCGRGAAVFRRNTCDQRSLGLAPALRTVAHFGIIALAGQRRRRRLDGAGKRVVSPSRRRVVADDMAAVRRYFIVTAQGFRLRRSDHLVRRRGAAGVRAGALWPPRIADRTTLLGALDHCGPAGARSRRFSGAVCLSQCALRQGSVVAIRVRRVGAAKFACPVAGRHDHRRIRIMAIAASFEAAARPPGPG